MVEVILSSQQETALDKIMAWKKSKVSGRFVLAGHAGTGKTTLARRIADEIPGTIFAAYTGKAANILRDKGCDNVNTLHGWIYQPRKKKNEDGSPKFGYDPKADWLDAPLVIVDEYSMLGEKLIEDIERAGVPILYTGDPFQLPPVTGECTLKPDYFLDQIHRQALESAIIRISMDVREGRPIAFGDHGDLKYLKQRETAPEMFLEADQVIIGRNDTRAAWNAKFRRINEFVSAYPVAGDKMICLKNNHDIGLFNGMIGRALNNCEINGLMFDLNFENIGIVKVWKGDVLGESANYDHYDKKLKGLQRFDYAYAITCHKSQGSEFDNVLVYNQPIGYGVEKRRWLYTGITRAKKNLTLVEPA